MKWRRHVDQRRLLVAAAAFAAAAGVATALTLPVPYVIISPGPVFNTLGEYRGNPVIDITGTTTYPTTGQLDMTTVRERGGPYGPLTAVEAVVAYVRDQSAVLPRELLFPDDESSQQSKDRSAADFDTAQANAVAAALGELGIPVSEAPLVVTVIAEGPSEGILEPNDVIVAVAGQPVSTSQSAVDAIRAQPIGATIPLTIKRDDTTLEVEVVSAPNPTDPTVGYIGVSLQPTYEAPFDIDFTLDGVGGPSAGLIFSLAIIDQLTPEQLTNGQQVAGTGTITPTGEVGAIGGIKQKMIAAKESGAVLFLAPEANCGQVVGNEPEGLTVAAVATLDEALTALGEFQAGRSVKGCGTSV